MSNDELIRQEIRSVARTYRKILRVWLFSVSVKAARVLQDGVHIAIELDEDELRNDSAGNYWSTHAEVDFQRHFHARLEAVCGIQLRFHHYYAFSPAWLAVGADTSDPIDPIYCRDKGTKLD